MSERRLLDVVTERLSLGRRNMRILRHRTARWFLPPVRQGVSAPLEELPRPVADARRRAAERSVDQLTRPQD